MQNSRLKEEERSRLEKLGFKKVVERDDEVKTLTRKLAIAYEHFRYVRKEKIDEFNSKLQQKLARDGSYKQLCFESISNTELVPPKEVLTKLESAKKFNCFDDFEIAYMAKIKDPILFGVIEDCSSKFYIAQWNRDIRIEDILTSKEG
jgi:hypothetical protein